MRFSTPITDFGKTFRLGCADKLLALGSCFAQVVGQRLCDRGVDIVLNPMGVLYNPKSICTLLHLAARHAEGDGQVEERLREMVFRANDGRYYSWLASSVISGESMEECHEQMMCAMHRLSHRLKEQTALLLTFGTDHYYEYSDTEGHSYPVANCHKMPQRCFEEKVMSIDEIAADLDSVYAALKRLTPNLRLIVSVSPYRYLKYGLHGSQLSKARLLLATERLQRTHGEVYYFPAYEIMNDELRDYRFYAADMVHPSDVAAEYIWQQFCANYINSDLLDLFKERERELKAAAHRPHNK